MKRVLKIEIECGNTTCASEPAKFCKYYGSRKFGQVYCCCLFGEDRGYKRSYTELEIKGGWIQRCAACLEAENLGKEGLIAVAQKSPITAPSKREKQSK